jgi:hypothetical protein
MGLIKIGQSHIKKIGGTLTAVREESNSWSTLQPFPLNIVYENA